MQFLIPYPAFPESIMRDNVPGFPPTFPEVAATKAHPPKKASGKYPSRLFVGTATTILEWRSTRSMTDPDFLRTGHQVYLRPGVMATRRSLPIITKPYARKPFSSKVDGESFANVFALHTFQSMRLDMESGSAVMRVPAMSGRQVLPGALGTMNDLFQVMRPANGWMLELGSGTDDVFTCGYRIYVSRDTLMVNKLRDIPGCCEGQRVYLMLAHLGASTLPSPKTPFLTVTMSAKQGLELVRLINRDLISAIHLDDYGVFLSQLDDFKKAVQDAGLSGKVVHLDQKGQYKFKA
ncbi:hypothetical protein BP6252_02075 [Coleophoma cylindrospora]|uniref:Uncharacterized protein n=1 Tax=Coleophoma cylindrospora TaxID=1849047 RepID=A0A3D8SDS1_9HELO|nr:hypothetical protein BP6252_02075 [Coleophoma cylindrospora]